MTTILLWGYFIPVTVFWIGFSLYLLVNSRKVSFLRDITEPADEAPAVAIIVAVRNEESAVERALQSVCHLAYRNKRILVINDRSTDRTPEILGRMKLLHPDLSVIDIAELPSGWLGKNHALYQGYLASREEYILFTDADVKFRPESLTKALRYMTGRELDHLAILPGIDSPSVGFSSIVDTFKLMLEFRQRPWAVRDPRSRASIGIGAFNLLRRSAYEKAGTHQAIRLRPDDDLKLGERIKAAGLRQDVLYGDGEIWLEWYHSIREFIDGLMKNTFSVSDYRLWKALGTALAVLLAFVMPLPGLLISGTTVHYLLLAIITLFQLPLFIFKRGMKKVWWYTFMVPVAGLIMTFIILKSAFLTIRQGGIYWRDHFYPLTDLKANK